MSPAVTKRGAWRQGVGYVKKNFLHGLELTDFSNHSRGRTGPFVSVRDHRYSWRVSSESGLIALR